MPRYDLTDFRGLGDTPEEDDEPISRRRARRVRARQSAFDKRVAEVAERNRAPHADAEVRVRYVEPWSLRPRPGG